MSTKEIARQVIESMPEQASMDDVIHALYLRAKFDHGDQQVRDGQGIAQDQARQRLMKWVK